MKWDRPQKKGVFNGKKSLPFNTDNSRISLYRPFFKQHLYFDRFWNNCVYQMPTLFPFSNSTNLLICVNQSSQEDSGQIALMTDRIPDLHFNGDTQCFPRWIYKKDEIQDSNLSLDLENEPCGGGYRRESAITKDALLHFRQAYPHENIEEDDIFYYIYGLLHSSDYQSRYANNLAKERPRIPRVATYEHFKLFSNAGRKLTRLHVNYEAVPKYCGVKINMRPNASLRISQMRWGKIPGKTGNAAKDKTRLLYNSDITIENIPLEAQEYVVNKRSALDWLVEKCRVSVDKASGIVNDFNDYGEEMGNPRYSLDLFLKVITVSLETMKIVKSLPPLEIHPLDQEQEK